MHNPHITHMPLRANTRHQGVVVHEDAAETVQRPYEVIAEADGLACVP